MGPRPVTGRELQFVVADYKALSPERDSLDRRAVALVAEAHALLGEQTLTLFSKETGGKRSTIGEQLTLARYFEPDQWVEGVSPTAHLLQVRIERMRLGEKATDKQIVDAARVQLLKSPATTAQRAELRALRKPRKPTLSRLLKALKVVLAATKTATAEGPQEKVDLLVQLEDAAQRIADVAREQGQKYEDHLTKAGSKKGAKAELAEVAS